jgi:hypothetical protein
MAPQFSIDVRRSRRVREANPIDFAIASGNYHEWHIALTMDKSLHGIRILTDFPLFPGEPVALRPEADSEDRISARVVWRQGLETSAGYVAGLEFAKPLC